MSRSAREVWRIVTRRERNPPRTLLSEDLAYPRSRGYHRPPRQSDITGENSISWDGATQNPSFRRLNEFQVGRTLEEIAPELMTQCAEGISHLGVKLVTVQIPRSFREAVCRSSFTRKGHHVHRDIPVERRQVFDCGRKYLLPVGEHRSIYPASVDETAKPDSITTRCGLDFSWGKKRCRL